MDYNILTVLIQTVMWKVPARGSHRLINDESHGPGDAKHIRRLQLALSKITISVISSWAE